MSSETDVGADAHPRLDPEAGERGIPVDAICTTCKAVRVKRAPGTPDEPATSFKHVCHACQTCTWWNTLAVLDGLLEADGGESA